MRQSRNLTLFSVFYSSRYVRQFCLVCSKYITYVRWQLFLLCVSEQALCFFGRVALFFFVSPVVRKEERAIIHVICWVLRLALMVSRLTCTVKKFQKKYPDSNLNQTKNVHHQDRARAGSERSFYVAKQIHPNHSLCVGVWTCGEAA